MKRCACILLILAAVFATPSAAFAQEADSTSAEGADSTSGGYSGSNSLLSGGETSNTLSSQAQSGDSTGLRLLTPTWKIEYRANESEYRLGTRLNLVFEPGDGWHGQTLLNIAKRDYRGRDMSDINETFNNSLVKIVPNSYNINLGIGQDYLRQKAIGLARSGGDMVIENKFLNMGASWDRPELWSRKSVFAVMGRAGGGQHDFKYDKNLQGSASGHLWYGLGDDLDLRGGYGIWRKTEDSDVSGRIFENMPSDMDTVSARVGYGFGEAKLLDLNYHRTVGVIRKVDPPRGNSLEVIENPDLAKMEKSSKQTEKITVRSSIRPTSYLAIEIEFLKDYFDQKNVVDDRLSKETELRRLRGKSTYRYSTAGNLIFEIERRENDVDYGPVSLSSYTEKERVLKAGLIHDITDSLKVTIRGSGSLKQRFYKKKDANPRDADYLYYSFYSDLAAGLPFNIRAGVKFTYKQYQTINIDRSLSGDNRTDYTYWVVPRFNLVPTTWFEIGQEYEIKMEFTDFFFNENENYLDRTTIMNTMTRFKFFKSILAITHRYRFLDTGSYLRPPDGGERLYGRTDESYEHRFDFRYDYMPVVGFTLYTRSNYRFQESNRLGEIDGAMGVVSTRKYDSGEMTLGFSRTTEVTESGNVDLDIGWVKRFGPNLTPERREFWTVDMNVEINF